MVLVQRLRPAAILSGILLGLGASAAGASRAADIVWLVTLIGGGAPIVFQTVRGMFHRRFAADIVASLAIVGAALTHEYLAGSVIVLMQTGGETLESFAVRRASKALQALIAKAPRIARLRDGETTREVPVETVAVDDRLVVRPGDLVPVDSLVTGGSAGVDESALTGEPLPVTKQPGDELMSGSICLDGALEIRALRLSRNSQFEQIVQLVHQAQSEKAPLARLADRYAVIFTPVTLGLCALAYVMSRQPDIVVAVLVVATPCPLILATPVAIISGINRAAHSGIIVKHGAAIEVIGRIRAAVFDKTGTLTAGRPTVEQVVSLDGLMATDILELSASLEQLSGHPMARAIVDESRRANSTLHMPEGVVESAGHGVSGMVNGHRVDVGSAAFAESRKIGKGDAIGQAQVAGRIPPERSTAFVGVDGRLVGLICFTDPIRPGLPALMSRLGRLGIQKIVMLTGDNHATAAAIGKKSGILDIRADLLPSGKVQAVRELQDRYGNVAMIGDGINDAPALASATVGVALGAKGAAVSAEAADIVISTDHLDRVAGAVEIGQHTLKIAHQSIWIGLGVSGIMMGIAAFGGIAPTAGALLQEGLDVAVIVNALRAR